MEVQHIFSFVISVWFLWMIVCFPFAMFVTVPFIFLILGVPKILKWLDDCNHVKIYFLEVCFVKLLLKRGIVYANCYPRFAGTFTYSSREECIDGSGEPESKFWIRIPWKWGGSLDWELQLSFCTSFHLQSAWVSGLRYRTSAEVVSCAKGVQKRIASIQKSNLVDTAFALFNLPCWRVIEVLFL